MKPLLENPRLDSLRGQGMPFPGPGPYTSMHLRALIPAEVEVLIEALECLREIKQEAYAAVLQMQGYLPPGENVDLIDGLLKALGAPNSAGCH